MKTLLVLSLFYLVGLSCADVGDHLIGCTQESGCNRLEECHETTTGRGNPWRYLLDVLIFCWPLLLLLLLANAFLYCSEPCLPSLLLTLFAFALSVTTALVDQILTLPPTKCVATQAEGPKPKMTSTYGSQLFFF